MRFWDNSAAAVENQNQRCRVILADTYINLGASQSDQEKGEIICRNNFCNKKNIASFFLV